VGDFPVLADFLGDELVDLQPVFRGVLQVEVDVDLVTDPYNDPMIVDLRNAKSYIVKNIKRPSGIFPSLPSGMDKILKEHFDRFMKKNELPPEIKEKCAGYGLFNEKPLLDLCLLLWLVG